MLTIYVHKPNKMFLKSNNSKFGQNFVSFALIFKLYLGNVSIRWFSFILMYLNIREPNKMNMIVGVNY